MANRNLTLSLPEELVRRARVAAARRDMSVSALVQQLLDEATTAEASHDSWAREVELMRRGDLLQVGPHTWSRDELHER